MRYPILCAGILGGMALVPARVQAQADTSNVIVCFGIGVGIESDDLGAFNTRLDGARLHHAADLPARLRLDLIVSGRRNFFAFSETVAQSEEHTDSSRITTNVINLQFCGGYPLIRDRKMLLAPMVGYRFSVFSYTHNLLPEDASFNAALGSSTYEVQLSHLRHEAVLGAYWSYGRTICFAAQAGYLLRLGEGRWRTTGSNTKLDNGPAIDPGFFAGASLMFRLDAHPRRWRLP